MKIGVISDTHNFFDPAIAKLFQGVEHILHGGDIGLPFILDQLRSIAPVTAVRGNTDEPQSPYHLTEVVTLAGRKFLLHHIVNPRSLEDSLDKQIQREQPQVVVFGHTHKPFFERIGSITFFNPGYAGKSRFGMERTVAILHCSAKEIRPEYIKL
jgi:putative phosphoesterase